MRITPTNSFRQSEATRILKCLLVAFLLVLMPGRICFAQNNAANISEYDLKAVCLYNFAHFAYWPAAVGPTKEQPIIIGVVGRSPFNRALEDLQAHLQQADKTNLTVVYHGPYHDGMDLRDSHLLFISSSEKKNLSAIIASLHGAPVLTVSDMPGFLEAGGMINLIVSNNKVRWAINRAALNSAGLQLNAKLLQLAVRIEESPAKPESHHHFPLDDDEWPLPAKAMVATPACPPHHRWFS
jgi:hypothetical protein